MAIPVRQQQHIDRALAKLKAWRAAPEYSKTAMAESVAKSREQLQEERDKLHLKIKQGDQWLQDHRDHAEFARYEDRWIEWLWQYNALSDAVTAMEEAA